MKKEIQIIMLLFLVTSCSKDENNSNEEFDVEVNPGNLFGVWYNKQTVINNGPVVQYVNACSTIRDNLHLKTNYSSDFHEYFSDCTEGGDLNIGYAFLLSTSGANSAISFGDVVPNHRITRLTNKTMHLEYDYFDGTTTTIITNIYTRE
jgi:hypothetical protein